MLDIKVIKVRFDEADIYEGSLPREVYDNAEEEMHENLEIHEAIDLIRNLGLTFEASGSDYAADPDGSRTIDYASARREEVSAHPQYQTGHDWEWAAVVAGVDAGACQRCMPGNHH